MNVWRRAGCAVRQVTTIASPSRRARTSSGARSGSDRRAITGTRSDRTAVSRPPGAVACTTTRTRRACRGRRPFAVPTPSTWAPARRVNDLAPSAPCRADDDRAQVAGRAAPHPCAHGLGGVQPLTRLDGHAQPRRRTRQSPRCLRAATCRRPRDARLVLSVHATAARPSTVNRAGEIVGVAHRRAERPRGLEDAVEIGRRRRERGGAASGRRPAGDGHASTARPSGATAACEPRRVEADRRRREGVDRRRSRDRRR